MIIRVESVVEAEEGGMPISSRKDLIEDMMRNKGLRFCSRLEVKRMIKYRSVILSPDVRSDGDIYRGAI